MRSPVLVCSRHHKLPPGSILVPGSETEEQGFNYRIFCEMAFRLVSRTDTSCIPAVTCIASYYIWSYVLIKSAVRSPGQFEVKTCRRRSV